MGHIDTKQDTGDLRHPKNNRPDFSGDRQKPGSNREEGNVEHVKDTGLPPGIQPPDLTDPNRNRPPVPNGDHS